MDLSEIVKKGKCCACEAPLEYSKFANGIQLHFPATWQYPVWGNFITGETQLAMAFICDRCFENGHAGPGLDIKYALEFTNDEAVYHPVPKT